MNIRKSLVLSAVVGALAVPGLSFATPLSQPIINPERGENIVSVNTPSTKTRAEVIGELQAAQKLGSQSIWSQERGEILGSVNTPSTKTRAEVISELQAAKKGGPLSIWSPERGLNIIASTDNQMSAMKRGMSSGGMANMHGDAAAGGQMMEMHTQMTMDRLPAAPVK